MVTNGPMAENSQGYFSLRGLFTKFAALHLIKQRQLKKKRHSKS